MPIAAGSHLTARAPSARALERRHAVGAVRVHRGNPLEGLRVRARRVARIGVGHVESRALRQRRAALVVRALEGVKQHLGAPQGCQQRERALDVAAIRAVRRALRAARVEEEHPPRVLAGAERALRARVDDHAARRIADAHQVRMRVPDLRRVEARPGRAHQLMRGETARQPREAGIPHALLGPQAPGGERAGAGERRAADQETSAVQGCFRRASS
jgi:hypothetical protein